MSGYPACLAFFASKISNVSVNTKQVRPLGIETAGPNTVLSFVMPQNTLCDTRSTQFHTHIATGSSSTTGNKANEWVVLPKHVESILDQITVSSGGVTISQTPAGIGQMMKLLLDYSQGQDRGLSRRVYQNQAVTGLAEAANSMPATSTYDDKDIILTNFPAFLGTILPQVFPTMLTNDVRIDIRFAPASVLACGGTTAPVNPTYSIGNPNSVPNASQTYLTVRTIDINDNIYYAMLAERLNSGPIEIPFQSIFATQGGLTTYSQRLSLPVSSQSVDMVLATFMPADYNLQGAAGGHNVAPYARTSKYFQRKGTGLATSQFSVNNDQLGIPANLAQVFSECLTEFGANNETVGGWDEFISSPTSWASDFFVHPLRLNLATSAADRIMSGSDSRGTHLQIAYTSSGDSTAVYPQLWVLCTSTLQISAGKVLNVIQ